MKIWKLKEENVDMIDFKSSFVLQLDLLQAKSIEIDADSVSVDCSDIRNTYRQNSRRK